MKPVIAMTLSIARWKWQSLLVSTSVQQPPNSVQ